MVFVTNPKPNDLAFLANQHFCKVRTDKPRQTYDKSLH